MYNFIFFVSYIHTLKDGQVSARINGSLVVCVAMIIHLGLITVVVKKYFPNFYKTLLPGSAVINKSIFAITFLIFLTAIYFYYNARKTESILKKRNEASKPSFPNRDILRVILLMVVPLILTFILGWKNA